MVWIGGGGRLRKESQSPGNNTVMMAEATMVMMQHQLQTLFAPMNSYFVA